MFGCNWCGRASKFDRDRTPLCPTPSSRAVAVGSVSSAGMRIFRTQRPRSSQWSMRLHLGSSRRRCCSQCFDVLLSRSFVWVRLIALVGGTWALKSCFKAFLPVWPAQTKLWYPFTLRTGLSMVISALTKLWSLLHKGFGLFLFALLPGVQVGGLRAACSLGSTGHPHFHQVKSLIGRPNQFSNHLAVQIWTRSYQQSRTCPFFGWINLLKFPNSD